MKRANKQKQEVALQRCVDRNSITFSGVCNNPANLKAFRSYVNHLNPAGLRNIKSEIKGSVIYYTAYIENKKRPHACHLIQLNARANKVTIPQWIGNHARVYREKNNKPKLINYPVSIKTKKTKQSIDVEALVKSKTVGNQLHTKNVVIKQKTSLLNKLFGWLRVKDI